VCGVAVLLIVLIVLPRMPKIKFLCCSFPLHRPPVLQPSHLAAQPDIVLLRCSRRERPPVVWSLGRETTFDFPTHSDASNAFFRPSLAAMIRKEAVQLSRPDPVAERRLADLRDRLAGLDAHVHSTSVAQLSAANTASSRAREEKYHRLHARLQTEEAMHKPFDKSWAIRECRKS
jgi:hypothetical protein